MTIRFYSKKTNKQQKDKVNDTNNRKTFSQVLTENKTVNITTGTLTEGKAIVNQKQNLKDMERIQGNVVRSLINVNSDIIDKDGFTLVKRQQRDQYKKDTLIGRNTKTSILKAPIKKAWIYVGGCETNTTSDMVKDYITTECPELKDVVCTQLETRGKLKAFQVGFDFIHNDKISTADFWPSNIKVRRFRFDNKLFRGHPGKQEEIGSERNADKLK